MKYAIRYDPVIKAFHSSQEMPLTELDPIFPVDTITCGSGNVLNELIMVIFELDGDKKEAEDIGTKLIEDFIVLFEEFGENIPQDKIDSLFVKYIHSRKEG